MNMEQRRRHAAASLGHSDGLLRAAALIEGYGPRFGGPIAQADVEHLTALLTHFADDEAEAAERVLGPALWYGHEPYGFGRFCSNPDTGERYTR